MSVLGWNGEAMEVRWIRLEDDQPMHGEIVLCADEYNPQLVCMGKYDMLENMFDLIFFPDIEDQYIEEDSEITHWMSVPLPPKTEESYAE